jgi:hypothetical protein
MNSLDEMVRDFTKTRPRAKSEVRRRILEYGNIKYKEGVMFGAAVKDDKEGEK